MATVNIEVYSSAGDSLYWASPRKAAEMVSNGAATWINQGWGRLCLRLAAPAQSSNHRSAPSLTSRDSEVSAGIVGTITEERAVRRRVESWAPQEVTP
jgi:hypothetical protein